LNSFSPPPIEFKALLALITAVLLLHIAMLLAMPLQPTPHRLVSSNSFTTRSVVLVPMPRPAAGQVSQPTPIPRRPELSSIASPASPEKVVDNDAAGLPSATLLSTNPPEDAPSGAASFPGAPQPAPEQAAAVVMTATLPGSSSLRYQVQSNKFPFRLNAELRWQNHGENYDARLELSAFGLSRAQTSQGLITQQGLAPVRFSDKYRSEVAAHFNRELGKVTFSANTPDVPLLDGAQDRLSILLQLAGMIATAPASYPANTVITTQIIGPRAADIWVFTVIGEETLSLPGGEQGTLKLTRNPRQEFDQKVEVWLAPALGYLPARIRITESNGDFVDQKWVSSDSAK
jgi:hypothetical protein